MGREIKRVALDFSAPLGETWEGYINPHGEHSRPCPFCEGSGYNPAVKQLSEDRARLLEENADLRRQLEEARAALTQHTQWVRELHELMDQIGAAEDTHIVTRVRRRMNEAQLPSPEGEVQIDLDYELTERRH